MAKNDASWIKKTLRKNTLLIFKNGSKDKGDYDPYAAGDLKFVDPNKAGKGKGTGAPETQLGRPHRASLAERKATLRQDAFEKRNSKLKLAASRRDLLQAANFGKEANQQSLDSSFDEGEEEVEEEEEVTEYETETEEESEEEEEDLTELNEMNFSKLLQLRLQSTDKQLEAYCMRYVFTIQKAGVKEVHDLADQFEELCKEIYEPMLAKKKKLNRSGTQRFQTLRQKEGQSLIGNDESTPTKKSSVVHIPKELPVEHEKTVEFFKKHHIEFETGELQKSILEGLHIVENCCFLQFLLLKYLNFILGQYLKRWDKKEEEVEKKNHGSLVLEEFFMPPLNIEPKLDTELVKFSKLLATRQYEINQFKKKMAKKEINSVAYNVLKNEMYKYIKELEEKLNVSEIYFAAAIMRIKQKQQKELDMIFDQLEKEEEDLD